VTNQVLRVQHKARGQHRGHTHTAVVVGGSIARGGHGLVRHTSQRRHAGLARHRHATKLTRGTSGVVPAEFVGGQVCDRVNARVAVRNEGGVGRRRAAGGEPAPATMS
jgi:hypothetical protein